VTRLSITPEPAHLALSLNGLQPTLTISNQMGTTWSIQAATDPAAADGWNVLTNLTMVSPLQVWVDSMADIHQPRRFYRAVWVRY
jgi:hypothetical protein